MLSLRLVKIALTGGKESDRNQYLLIFTEVMVATLSNRIPRQVELE
jgi:hypothetical protein